MKIRGTIIQKIVYCLLPLAALVAGCDQNSLDTTIESHQLSAGQAVIQVAPGGHDLDVSCVGMSGLLTPAGSLELGSMNSLVAYDFASVLSPTVVSFNICKFDTTGNSLAPRVQVFGPDPNTTFLRDAKVAVSLDDAGIAFSESGKTRKFKVFRLNDSTGIWSLHETGNVDNQGNSGTVKYKISRNGTYAISMAKVAILPDSVWTIAGLIQPGTGGTLNLLNSSLVVPPLAVGVPTMVTFTLHQEIPEGLANALPRVFEFSPEGTNFTVPVTLNIDLGDAGFDGMSDQVITLYYFDEQNSTWMRQANAVERTGNNLTVRLNHFSRYAFAR